MNESTQNRRKALIDAYKRQPKLMGIYEIRNLANGFCLVNTSKDVAARLNRHQMDLKTGGDRNVALQRDWDKYTASQFTMQLLEALEPGDEVQFDPDGDLEILKVLWLEKYDPQKLY